MRWRGSRRRGSMWRDSMWRRNWMRRRGSISGFGCARIRAVVPRMDRSAARTSRHVHTAAVTAAGCAKEILGTYCTRQAPRLFVARSHGPLRFAAVSPPWNRRCTAATEQSEKQHVVRREIRVSRPCVARSVERRGSPRAIPSQYPAPRATSVAQPRCASSDIHHEPLRVRAAQRRPPRRTNPIPTLLHE